MNVYWVWLVVPFYVLSAWVATTWIRARYGVATSPMDEAIFGAPGALRGRSSAVEACNRKLMELEERIRVLERIVTDREAQFRDEFDRL